MFIPPPAGFIAFALMGLWIVAVSIVMQRPEPLAPAVGDHLNRKKDRAMTTPEEVICSYVEAMSAADGDSAVAVTADDAVIELPNGGALKGKEGVRQFAAKHAEIDGQKRSVTLTSLEARTPNRFLATLEMTNRELETGELLYSMDVGSTFEVRDGLIVHQRVFPSVEEAAAAVCVETINGCTVIHPSEVAQEAVRFGPTEMAGSYVVEAGALPPGAGPSFHLHPNTDEMFYIADGRATFKLGDRELQLGAGSLVFVPRGTPHTALVYGDVPLRGLILISPGDAEHEFVPVDAR